MKIGRFNILFFIVLLVVLFCLWLWQSIWGFGGIYTHVRYMPTPPNLLADEVNTPLTIDGVPRRWRRYVVAMSLQDLREFHQAELPEAGWTIVKQGFVTITRGEKVYCLISQQRGVTAYISIRQGRVPQESKTSTRSSVIISIDKPDPAYCDYDKIK